MLQTYEKTADELHEEFACLNTPRIYDDAACAQLADAIHRIRLLKAERNAVVLAHNYQRPEIFEVADFMGDSLELARQATTVIADVIVFCGVHFMAETAKILNPEKTVLLPDLRAGCSLADTVTAEELVERRDALRRLYPDLQVVAYVNTTADVKAVADVCCTSANAVKVVNSLPSPRVLMVPDRNLALYTARHTEKEVLYWEGCCNVHDGLTAAEVLACREAHPKAVFLAHPECRPEVLDLATVIRSTAGMLEFVRRAPETEFIIGTEQGIIHTLQKENPGKIFYSPSPNLVCPDMKRITLDDILAALDQSRHRITVPPEVRLPALKAVERMLAVPRD